MCSSQFFSPTIKFEKVYNLWVVFDGTRKDTRNISQYDTKVEEDSQQTETIIVPATFMKHLVTIKLDNKSQSRRGRDLKNNQAPCKAKWKSKHTTSHGKGRFTIVIFICSVF